MSQPASSLPEDLARELKRLRFRSTLALSLAFVMFVGWALSSVWAAMNYPILRPDFVGQHYVDFRSGDGTMQGGVKDDYGKLQFWSQGKNGSTHVTFEEDGITVTLRRKPSNETVAEWKLTPEGAKFQGREK